MTLRVINEIILTSINPIIQNYEKRKDAVNLKNLRNLRIKYDSAKVADLNYETIIKMMIGMGGNSLCKEIYDWFNYAEDTASVSAFVQQRQKI